MCQLVAIQSLQHAFGRNSLQRCFFSRKIHHTNPRSSVKPNYRTSKCIGCQNNERAAKRLGGQEVDCGAESPSFVDGPAVLPANVKGLSFSSTSPRFLVAPQDGAGHPPNRDDPPD